MTESQEKELFAMFRKQHEQAIAGDYVFMPTITPLHFGHILDRIEALEQDAANSVRVTAAQIHYPQCWDTAAYPTLESAVHEFGPFVCATCAEVAQQDKGKETV